MAARKTRIRMAGLIMAWMMLAGVARAGESEVEKLKQGLQNPKKAARVEPIRILKVSEAEAGKAADLLVPSMVDKSTQIQPAASAALLKSGKEAVPALVQALQSKEAKVRRESLSILDQLWPQGQTGGAGSRQFAECSDGAQ